MSLFVDYRNATYDACWKCEERNGGITFWICSILVSSIFGFPGAVAVLFNMFQKGRKGTPFTPYDVFVSNLTVMDVLFLFIILSELYFQPHWNFFIYKRFLSLSYSLNFCGRPLFLTCICLDCYMAVLHPVTYRARKSLTPRVLLAVGVWTVTALFGTYSAIIEDGVWNDVSPIVLFVVALSVIGFCDFSILWTLKRSNPGGKDVHPQKKKALQIITINLVLTFISYFPPIITLLLSRLLVMDHTTICCLVLVPVTGITLLGNTVSLLMHLYNLGKLDLDLLKCWKHK